MTACHTDAESLTAALHVRHGFFTRRGGVSTGPFASLNCSLSGQDSREAVLENRARAARAVGAAPEALVDCLAGLAVGSKGLSSCQGASSPASTATPCPATRAR